MALVKDITKTVTVPGEDTRVVIRKLSHKQLKVAARAKQSEGVTYMKEIGAELLSALRSADTEAVQRIEETQAANVNNYDRDTLLKEGIASWTYDVTVADGLELLDEPTAAFLTTEIFAFSRPTPPAAAKN